MTFQQRVQKGRIGFREFADETAQSGNGETRITRQAFFTRHAVDRGGLLQHGIDDLPERRLVFGHAKYGVGDGQGNFSAGIIGRDLRAAGDGIAQNARLDVALNVGETGLRVLQRVLLRLL